MDLHASLMSLALVGLTASILLFLLYRFSLPKPFPGIPYNESSARQLLGDVPAMSSHIANEGGSFITYLIATMRSLNAPLVQVFIKPLGTPVLVLADFREAHDLLVRRKDFDRSNTLGDLVKGLAPDHHIHLKTNAAWKKQRRLTQDLMTPSFLHNVAAPSIFLNATALIDLWRVKCRIADGRPWSPFEDVNRVSLDALCSFTFGEGFSTAHSATGPALELMKGLDKGATERLRSSGGLDEAVKFPEGHLDDVLQAILSLTKTVGEVQWSPVPSLMWAYVMQKSWVKKAVRKRDDSIHATLKDAFERMERVEGSMLRSAVDHMIVKERSLAEKDGRNPEYFSRIMKDEIFGFIFAGHETTSTTICWGLKFLTDNPTTQTRLRNALQSSFTAAKSKGRSPSTKDITSTSIPYLDATIEEVLRCAGTAPVVDRQALIDTEILGHRIPRGTVVCCLGTGPGMMSPGFKMDEARRSTRSQTEKKERRAREWDPYDISSFKPERWLVRRAKGEEEFDPTAGPFLAFGLGTRGCYGKRLAYLEIRVLLVLIVWNFELLICPPELSGYKSVLITTTEPTQCYVRLREVDLRK